MFGPGHVIDIYDDAEAVHIRDGEALKKYGSSLRVDMPEDLRPLSDKDFALILLTKTGEMQRKYPMHNPHALALSTHYFERVSQNMPEEARKIAAAGLVKGHLRFGAEPPAELQKLAGDLAVQPYFCLSSYRPLPVAAPAEAEAKKYAYAVRTSNGDLVEMFPVDTLPLALASAEAIKKHASSMQPRDRYLAAAAVNEEIVKLGGQKDADLEKISSPMPNPAFSSHIAARMSAVNDAESQSTLLSIQALSGTLGGVKIAQALEAFDQKAGLDLHWGTKLVNPWEACFLHKEASVKVGDQDVTSDDLVKLIDSGKLASMFKKAQLEDFRKEPLVVFTSLPEPARHQIAGLL